MGGGDVPRVIENDPGAAHLQILILIMAEAGFVGGADIYDHRLVGRALHDGGFSLRGIWNRRGVRREGDGIQLKGQNDVYTKGFQIFPVLALSHDLPPVPCCVPVSKIGIILI